MERIEVFIDGKLVIDADTGCSRAELPEALIELGNSLIRLRNNGKDILTTNDSEKPCNP